MTRRPLLAVALLASVAPALPAQQKEAPPPVAPPAPRALPARRTFTLPNGLRVALVPYGSVPKALVRLYVRTGAIDQGPAQTWLAQLTADLLNEGTVARSGAEVAELVAGMGGSLGIGASDEVTTLSAEVLGERAADAVALVAEVAQQPRFPEGEFARVRAGRLRQLAIARSRPQTLAMERMASLMFGDHPFGRVLPTEASFGALTLADARAFWQANAGAQRSTLYVIGVFDAKAVEAAVRARFAGWTKGPAPSVRPPAPRAGRRLEVIDRPKAPQSTLITGLPVAGPSSPDWIPLEVTDALLGGAFGSRITANIREAKGYTYSPFSSVDDAGGVAIWSEMADVTTNVTGAALTEIFKEAERLRGEAPPAAELAGIKNNLVGLKTLQTVSRGGLAANYWFAESNGLGEAYLRDYAKRVMAVTPEQVRSTARQYLDPAKMAIVVVGDTAVVNAQLAPFTAAVP
ncbi:MAG: pitrilysin family protein [Gemmatimonadales bacterium]|nr:pitrilysin family protein [Gemmatimonadales bacterium]